MFKVFKRTKLKITVVILGSLLIFLGITLTAVVFSQRYEISRENMKLLEHYIEIYDLDDQPGGQGKRDDVKPQDPPPDAPEQDGRRDGSPSGRPGERMSERVYQVSTFYSVAFSNEGEVLAVDNGDNSFRTQDELIETAKKILDGKKSSGRTHDLIYSVKEKDGYTLVAFIDNTLANSDLGTLIKNTLISGGSAILVFAFISFFIAGKIVRPLEENNRRQRRFVSDAGHELKTPISVIGANTELLEKEVGHDNEWLSNIRYENERMGTLVTELLDLSRTESAVPTMEEIDLSRLVTGDILPFESVAFELGLAIESDIEDGIVIEGNRSQLSQLTSILLDNAICHRSGGDKIGVTLKRDRRGAVLSVENSCDGISEDKLEHLFERFYRVDDARVDSGGHYGLGLSIAKAITDAHKGTITATCRDGKIIFTVTLHTIR
ncbi:MAG: HAMP domain-containing histidine kinase [Clostridia bacterium]|nr:HAMP domain-containing histidine kinase [Clostridia bacterium]